MLRFQVSIFLFLISFVSLAQTGPWELNLPLDISSARQQARKEVVEDVMAQVYKNIITNRGKVNAYRSLRRLTDNQVYHMMHAEVALALKDYIKTDKYGVYKIAKLAGINEVLEGSSRAWTKSTNLHNGDNILKEFIEYEPFEFHYAKGIISRDVELLLINQFSLGSIDDVMPSNIKTCYDEIFMKGNVFQYARKKGVRNELQVLWRETSLSSSILSHEPQLLKRHQDLLRSVYENHIWYGFEEDIYDSAHLHRFFSNGSKGMRGRLDSHAKQMAREITAKEVNWLKSVVKAAVR